MLEKLRNALSKAGSIAVVWDTGIWTQGSAERIGHAVAGLATAFEDVRLFPMAERANTVGTLLTGMAPTLLPGIRSVNDAKARAEIESVLGSPSPKLPGKSWDTIFSHGDIKALYVMGEDLIDSAPDPDGIREALRACELLVVQDIFMSPTAEVADVVLPGTSFAEKQGHFTNFEGRLVPIAPAIIPVGDARPDWEIIARLAAALGKDFGWRTTEPISDEIAQLWREPDIQAGTPIETINVPERPGIGTDTFVLSAEQHLYTAGATGRRAPSLACMLPEAVAELNPDDATRLNVTNGDPISLASDSGSLNLKALVARRVPRGVVNLPDRFLDAPPQRLNPKSPNGTRVHVTKR